MVTRRQSREWALQMLVQFDINPPESTDAAAAAFWEQVAMLERDEIAEGVRDAKAVLTSDDPRVIEELPAAREFAETRAKGVWRDREEIDRRIGELLERWPLYRLGSVERAALRLGAWELENCRDIPAPIVINEAVDLAKWFSETRSGRFVNGVLDRYAKRLAERRREEECGGFTP